MIFFSPRDNASFNSTRLHFVGRLGRFVLIVLLCAVPSLAGASSKHIDELVLRLDVYSANESAYNVTSTLIHGATEAMLIDAQFRLSDAEKVADMIAATHTTLKAIFITHPDPDHYIGLAALHKRYPDTPIYMTSKALAEFKKSVGYDLESVRKRAPSETPDAIPVPAPLPTTRFMLDGQAVLILADLQGDFSSTPANSLVYVPSLKAVITGDIVFHGIHPWTDGSTADGRAGWLTSLEMIRALQPRMIVPGHGVQEPETGLVSIDFMERYITDFDSLVKNSADAEHFVAAMEKRYPGLGQPVFLKIAAASAFNKSNVQNTTNPTPAELAEVRKVIEDGNTAWGHARVAIDQATFDKMLAPAPIFYVQLPDQRLTRQQFIDRISKYPAGVRLSRFDPMVLTIQPEEDHWVALILERLEFERKTDDGKTEKRYVLSITKDIWKKTGSEWKILSSELLGAQGWKEADFPHLAYW